MIHDPPPHAFCPRTTMLSLSVLLMKTVTLFPAGALSTLPPYSYWHSHYLNFVPLCYIFSLLAVIASLSLPGSFKAHKHATSFDKLGLILGWRCYVSCWDLPVFAASPTLDSEVDFNSTYISNNNTQKKMDMGKIKSISHYYFSNGEKGISVDFCVHSRVW